MGLFSFLNRNKKASVPTPPKPDVSAKADEMIRQQKVMVLENTVAALGVNIDNLNIDYYNNNVTVSGLAKSDNDRIAVANALNTVEGVYSIDNRIEVAEVAPQFETYVIKKGDSLSKIAKHYYGDAMKYKELFEANKDVLKDANTIFPGQEIKIPLK